MRVVCCLVAAALVGCASSQPQKPEAPKEISYANIVELQKAGYKIVNENGTKLYCREHTHTGTRVKKSNVCYTEAELLAAGRNSGDALNELQRHTKLPEGR